MCKYKIYVSSDAKQDLLSIRSYIDKVCQSSVTSQKLMVSIDKALFRLDANPHRCPKISNGTIKKYGVRKLIIKNYIIFFRIDDKTKNVQILRVLYARRNWEKLV